MLLSVIDLTMTYFYIRQYKAWQPDKSFNKMESNWVLLFTWGKFGLNLGMVLGSIVILSLIFTWLTLTHWILWVITAIVLLAAIRNHIKNFIILNHLIKKEKKENVR